MTLHDSFIICINSHDYVEQYYGFALNCIYIHVYRTNGESVLNAYAHLYIGPDVLVVSGHNNENEEKSKTANSETVQNENRLFEAFTQFMKKSAINSMGEIVE